MSLVAALAKLDRAGVYINRRRAGWYWWRPGVPASNGPFGSIREAAQSALGGVCHVV